MNIVEELKAILEDQADDWSNTDKEAAQQIAVDLSRLMARDVAGEEISEEELNYAKAGARNIAAAASLSGVKAFEELLVRIGDKLMTRFLP